MGRALAYEWMRLRTLRSTQWLTVIPLVIAALIGLGIGISTNSDIGNGQAPVGPDRTQLGAAIATQAAAVGAPTLIGFVLAIIGVFCWGHEYRHGMIRASLTALNHRGALWTAKYVVVGVWVVCVNVLASLLGLVVASIFIHGQIPLWTSTTWQLIGRDALLVLLLAWLAMSLTAITRSQAFALTMLFVWPLLVEGVITALFHLIGPLQPHIGVTRFLPFHAGDRIVQVVADTEFGPHPLSASAGLGVFGGLTVVLMIAGYVLFERRDA